MGAAVARSGRGSTYASVGRAHRLIGGWDAIRLYTQNGAAMHSMWHTCWQPRSRHVRMTHGEVDVVDVCRHRGHPSSCMRATSAGGAGTADMSRP